MGVTSGVRVGEGFGGLENKKWFLMVNVQVNAFLRMAAWLFSYLNPLPQPPQPTIDMLTLNFTISEKGSSMTADESGGLPGSWQDPIPRRLCMHSFFWSALWSMAQHYALVLREIQKISEHHRESLKCSFHLTPLWSMITFYPQRAHYLLSQVSSFPCTWRLAANGWTSLRHFGGCQHSGAGCKSHP